MFQNSFKLILRINIDSIPERISRGILSVIPEGEQEKIFEEK